MYKKNLMDFIDSFDEVYFTISMFCVVDVVFLYVFFTFLLVKGKNT